MCGTPAWSSSHPAIIPAHATKQQKRSNATRSWNRTGTITSNRNRDAGEHPKAEIAVRLDNSKSSPFQPECGVAVETPLETAAECRDVEAAQFATRMRGINDD